MVEDWEISRATGRCAASNRPLAEGEAYYAVLMETPAGLERRDYCEEAWTGPPEGTFCYWRGRVPVREKKRSAIAVDTAVLAQLFTQLEDAASESRQQLRFVLALLLMRKRLLKMDRTVSEEGQEYWLMRMPADQSVHRVLNPRLEKDQIDRLSAQLSAILSGEVDALQMVEEAGNEGMANDEAPMTNEAPMTHDEARRANEEREVQRSEAEIQNPSEDSRSSEPLNLDAGESPRRPEP